LWRPLPYANPDRLVVLTSAQQTETGVKTFSSWAPLTYEALRPPRTTPAAVARARRESEFLRHAERHPRARPRVPHRRRGARRRSQRDRQRSAMAHIARGRSGDRAKALHPRRPPPEPRPL